MRAPSDMSCFPKFKGPNEESCFATLQACRQVLTTVSESNGRYHERHGYQATQSRDAAPLTRLAPIGTYYTHSYLLYLPSGGGGAARTLSSRKRVNSRRQPPSILPAALVSDSSLACTLANSETEDGASNSSSRVLPASRNFFGMVGTPVCVNSPLLTIGHFHQGPAGSPMQAPLPT